MTEKGTEAWKLGRNQPAVLYPAKPLQKGKKKKEKKKQLSKDAPALKRPFSELGGFLLDHATPPPPHLPRSLYLSLLSCRFILFLFLLIAASPGRCRRSFLTLTESSETLCDNERGRKRQKAEQKSVGKKSVRVWFLVWGWCVDVWGICCTTDMIAKEWFLLRENISIYQRISILLKIWKEANSFFSLYTTSHSC